MAVATVTYNFPVAGATAPTVAQAAGCNSLTCQVNMADADTTGTITHNWQLTTAQLANLWPLISVRGQDSGTGSPVLSFALTNSVAVTVTKQTNAGSGGTYVVTLLRPHSMIT